MKQQRTMSYLLSKKINSNELTNISAAHGTFSWSLGLTYQSETDFDRTNDINND